MSEQSAPAETLSFADGEVTLYRGVKLMDGAKQVGTVDRMIVRHQMGNEEDIAVLKEDGRLKAKRIQTHLIIKSPPSPALDSVTSPGYSFEDLDEKNEKRLLAIYKRFLDKPPA